MSVGRCTSSMTFAIEKVFPVPVAPSSTCAHSPFLSPLTKDFTAFG